MIQKSLNGKFKLTVHAACSGGNRFTSPALKYKLKVLAFYLNIDNLFTFVLVLPCNLEANIALFISILYLQICDLKFDVFLYGLRTSSIKKLSWISCKISQT